MKEKPKGFEEMVGKVERAQGKSPSKESVVSFVEQWASPEEGAEQLYALWRDYSREKFSAYSEAIKKAGGLKRADRDDEEKREALIKNIEIDPRFRPLQDAIRARFQDEQVRSVFERVLELNLAGEEKLAPSYENHLREKRLKDDLEKRRLELYSDIFSHREKEPGELLLIELAILATRIKTIESKMRCMEREDRELAAKISFERLKTYWEQLKKEGFIWTSSREKYFSQILDSLVKLNKNRPIFLYGETGTGKTQLARAVAFRLTGRDPYEVGEEAKTDIRPLLGFREIEEGKTAEKGKTFVTYGQLGEAISGKHSSRDEEAGPGGIFYMDEMNGYPPDALRSLIKQLSGRRHGDLVGFSAWFGNQEAIAPNFGFIGSANLASEKHPDRPALTPEVARELRPGAIEVEYPLQTADDPEIYEMMLAALMDQNDRIRVRKEELAPAWKEVVDALTNSKHWEVNTDPKAGGALWRFANFIAETQKSYQGKENILTPTERDASYLGGLSPLDIGVVIDWLQEYRKSDKRAQKLSVFLAAKISEWGSHKLDSEEDRNLIKKFQEEFSLT